MRFAPAALAIVLAAPTVLLADDASEWTFGGVQPDSATWNFTPSRAPIGKSDVEHYAGVLNLDEAQRAALDALLETIATHSREIWLTHAEAVADANAHMRMSQDWNERQGTLNDLTEVFRAERQKLIDGFFDDLRLFLSPEQEEKWSAVERDRRRSDTLVQYACFDDESIDLVSVVDAVNLSQADRAALEPILERYAQSLDPVLAARNRKSDALAASIRDFQKAQASAYPRSGDVKPEEMMKAQQRVQEMQQSLISEALELRQASMRVRDVNRQFMDELRKAMPDSAQEDWKKVAKPKRDRGNPWGSYSRSKAFFSTIDNLDQVRDLAASRMGSWGDEEGTNEYMLLMRSVEPLSAEQRRKFEAIRDECKGALERLEREHEPAPQADADEKYLSIPTSSGTITLYKVDPDNQSNPYAYFYNSQKEDPEYLERRAEIEQEAINALRRVLTINQRSVVAYY